MPAKLEGLFIGTCYAHTAGALGQPLGVVYAVGAFPDTTYLARTDTGPITEHTTPEDAIAALTPNGMTYSHFSLERWFRAPADAEEGRPTVTTAPV